MSPVKRKSSARSRQAMGWGLGGLTAAVIAVTQLLQACGEMRTEIRATASSTAAQLGDGTRQQGQIDTLRVQVGTLLAWHAAQVRAGRRGVRKATAAVEPETVYVAPPPAGPGLLGRAGRAAGKAVGWLGRLVIGG